MRVFVIGFCACMLVFMLDLLFRLPFDYCFCHSLSPCECFSFWLLIVIVVSWIAQLILCLSELGVCEFDGF